MVDDNKGNGKVCVTVNKNLMTGFLYLISYLIDALL
jgi:hypothetical protein